MQQVDNKIKSFTDLSTWQESHKFVLEIYKTVKGFPEIENFGLSSQMRRAAVSVTSNIAEGFSRKTPKDKTHFYRMSQGSVTELQSQLLIARDLGYVGRDCFDSISEISITCHKLLTGLIKAVEREG